MHIIRSIDKLPSAARGGAVSIGNFDGVHLGHVKIVRRLLERAAEVGGNAVVFTFDPHPVRILRPESCPPPLTWTERKADLLAAHGVDWIIAYPTDEALLGLSAEEFFEAIVRDKLAARAMVEGPNFFFGHNRQGTIGRLRELTSAAGVSLDVVEPYEMEGELVSSSRVRALLAEGNVAAARRMLGQPYRIRGLVTHGVGRGAQLGFPTANLDGVDTLLPALGVYAGLAWAEGARWPAAIHIGPNVTFGEEHLKVEAHLLGRTESLYGQTLELDFLDRLRDIRNFESANKLKEQLARDVSLAAEAADRFPAD